MAPGRQFAAISGLKSTWDSGGSERWRPERAGEFHISRAKMLTDRLCKHTLINTIL